MRLIDADALLERLNEVYKGTSLYSDWIWFLGIASKEVHDTPTIDPVKHGRWVYAGSSIEKVYECSECGQVEFGEEHDNYCPNCGARMDCDE